MAGRCSRCPRTTVRRTRSPAAVNAILDQNTLTPFFTSARIAYDHPVESARGTVGNGAGVTLFKLDLAERPSDGNPERVPVLSSAMTPLG